MLNTHRVENQVSRMEKLCSLIGDGGITTRVSWGLMNQSPQGTSPVNDTDMDWKSRLPLARVLRTWTLRIKDPLGDKF
jgi:hypothetical protein